MRVLCFALSLSLSGCDLISDPQKRVVSIVLNAANLGDSAFSPNPVRAHFGGHIVWHNNDKQIHSIVGDAQQGACAFKSEASLPHGIRQGQRFSQTFLRRVICNYYCGIHGRGMRGRIIVE